MIPRQRYLERITPFINRPVIKVLTGVRRCGKSTLLKLLIEHLRAQGISNKALLYINKDSLAFDHIKTYRDLYDYVQARLVPDTKTYVFIDEVQEIFEWERAVGSLFAEERTDLYITGSNASLLSTERATLLTGRYLEIPIQTLVFSEFLQFRNAPETDREREFGHFLTYGGFPGLHQMTFSDESLRQYLEAIYNTVLLKDVVTRNALRDVHLLERIVRYAVDNTGNLTSAKRIADYLKSQKIKTSVDTVLQYLQCLCDALVLYKVSRYDVRGKAHLALQEKYYPGDIGLHHVLWGNRFTDISGKLENIVFLELRSRGYRISIGKVDQREVDFIAEKNGQKIYLQVCYLLSGPEVIEREYGALEAVQEAYPKYVLSMDPFMPADRNGIRWMNMMAFLLSKEF